MTGLIDAMSQRDTETRGRGDGETNPFPASPNEMHLRDELRMEQRGRACLQSRLERAVQIIEDLRQGKAGAEARADLFIGANE